MFLYFNLIQIKAFNKYFHRIASSYQCSLLMLLRKFRYFLVIIHLTIVDFTQLTKDAPLSASSYILKYGKRKWGLSEHLDS